MYNHLKQHFIIGERSYFALIFLGHYCMHSMVIMSPKPEGWGGGGHIVFGADPVGIRVRIASFPCFIF